MTQNQIKKLESSINKGLQQLSASSYHYAMNVSHEYNYESGDDDDEDEKTGIYESIKDLYQKIALYFEIQNINSYREEFIATVKPYIDSKEKALTISGPLFSESDPFVEVVSKIEKCLSPFNVFNEYHKNEDEINILEEILRNSSKIIAHTKTKITKEADIYKEVKWVLEMIFPQTRNLHKARFISKFQTYHPDILIPELKLAIEYKLIHEGDNVDKFIDQIKTDADNYDGDHEFQEFYAVIYFMDKTMATEKATRQSWIEKKFPENWNLIVVFN
jgi:hypothetical protein